jgi:oxygen-independent coproporphyrinogen-3 oxidase
VHVPFCTARCDYCDFFTTVVSVAAGGPAGRDAAGVPDAAAMLIDAYVAAVAAEWERERAAHGVRRIETLYLGGGTPALLGPVRLERLVSCFDAWLTPHAEVTVETNPDEVDDAFSAWAGGRGVRVSLGVQSFDPATRAALGRRPTADPATAARRLRAAGVRDLSVDLIHGIPGQTAGDLDADLAALADLAPDHVSWYELDVVDGTPLAKRLGAREGLSGPGGGGDAREGPCGADDETRAALYRHVVRGLERLGYRWYEVSNFARPGRRARHNVACWRARPYLGLGPGAVSTVGRRRWRNVPDVRAYVGALGTAAEPGREAGSSREAGSLRAAGSSRTAEPPREVEALDGETLARERLLLAARCGLPVPLAEVRAALDTEALGPLAAAGLLSLHSGTIRVTRKGRYVANAVCVRLFRA